MFALQGTNTHLILASPANTPPPSALATAGASTPVQLQRVTWQSSRTWPLPPAHLMVCSVGMAGRGKAVFACQPDSPRLAFLSTHRVLQQPLLPTSALLEVAAAAHAMLSSDSTSAGDTPCLHGVVIAAPYLLTEHAPELVCSVSLETGVVEVQSAGNNTSSRGRLHMAATLSQAAAADGNTPTSHTHSHRGGNFLQRLLAAEVAKQAASEQPMPCIAAAGLSDSSSCGGLLAANSPSEGFLLHPAMVEAALQMQAMRQQQQQQQPGDSSKGPTDAAVSAPATIKAYLLPRPATTTAAGAWQELQLSALLGCMQPAGAAAGQHGISTSSMQLSSGGLLLASLVDAAFRPMQGGGFAAATAAATTATAVNQDPTSATAPASTSPVLDAAEVAQLVQRTVEAVLGEAVDSQQPLMAAGLDSLGATEVRNSLQASLGLELPATLVCFLNKAVSQQHSECPAGW